MLPYYLKGGMTMKLNHEAIKSVLPHTSPFLLVDHAEIIDENTIVGYKKCYETDFYFQGHFPNHPIMPGVIIVEACAQTGAILLLSKIEYKQKMSYFAGIDHVRFRKRVHVNDELKMRVTLISIRKDIGKASIEAFVNDETVMNGEILFTIEEAL